MGVRTRLGIAALVNSQGGSVELPEEITLFCPQCGEKAADKGQCLVGLVKIPEKSKTGFVVRLMVDCRACGCYGKEPGASFYP